MKNIVLKFLVLAIVMVSVSCNDEISKTLTDEYVGLDTKTTSLLFLRKNDGQTVNVGIPVNLIGTQKSSPVNFTYDVINSSTAIEGLHYSVDSKSGSIPANSFAGVVPISIMPDNLEPGEIVKLDLALRSADLKLASTDTISYEYQITCISDIKEGMYTAASTGTSTDGCCTAPADIMASGITVTAKGDGVYTISDFSGGLYNFWYKAVYGYDDMNLVGDFVDVCNSIQLLLNVEPYGAGLAGAGSYDAATGNITLSWINGFGDEGTSIFSPVQ